MRLIDADEVLEEIRKQNLLAKELPAKRCMEIIGNATTYNVIRKKCVEWIPIEERLPENDGLYQICLKNGYISAVEYVTDSCGSQDWELWTDSVDVVAWSYLPEPYPVCNR